MGSRQHRGMEEHGLPSVEQRSPTSVGSQTLGESEFTQSRKELWSRSDFSSGLAERGRKEEARSISWQSSW